MQTKGRAITSDSVCLPAKGSDSGRPVRYRACSRARADDHMGTEMASMGSGVHWLAARFTSFGRRQIMTADAVIGRAGGVTAEPAHAGIHAVSTGRVGTWFDVKSGRGLGYGLGYAWRFKPRASRPTLFERCAGRLVPIALCDCADNAAEGKRPRRDDPRV